LSPQNPHFFEKSADHRTNATYASIRPAGCERDISGVFALFQARKNEGTMMQKQHFSKKIRIP